MTQDMVGGEPVEGIAGEWVLTLRTWSGAPNRIRTCGLLLRRQTLYPLSYGRAGVN